MAKKNRRGVMYSTDANFEYDEYSDQQETLANEEQLLYVSIDRKKRAGKTATLIEGFVGTSEDLKSLAKRLKSSCGVGGSAKNNEIIIQGDFKDKIAEILLKENYQVRKKG